MTFTKRELFALKIMMRELADYCREDLMGAILYTGAFHALPEDDDHAVVRLADKLRMTKHEERLTARGRRPKIGERVLHRGKIKTMA